MWCIVCFGFDTLALGADDSGFDLVSLFSPERETRCELVTGDRGILGLLENHICTAKRGW